MDSRHKCAACFRQFNKMEHLVEHMRVSYHSVHEPMCGICKKHCRSFESLREHLIGPLPKLECKNIFNIRGCRFCLTILDTSNARMIHQDRCRQSNVHAGILARMANLGLRDSLSIENGYSTRGSEVVGLACKMVGGGSDGSLDVCGRVCLIDDNENIIFHTYVKPPIPVTNYRYESTGIRAEYLRDAMPLRMVQSKIQTFLCNGEPMWKIRPRGGKARIVVGHDLDRLQLEYPPLMIRDTAKYPPLMKTSKLSNSLKYLTQAYLGYEIQNGIQDPYEDCVAAMRLYMRMRSQRHKAEEYPLASDPQNRSNFASWRQNEVEKMNPDDMLALSRSDYYCWCMDS
ncbi:RNA exonuclease 4-like [Mercurialis annua]|uniref:RNA exonuclease 4-like n=1 Tax=Mercurialis annua TaxID=3986 RepID=UPI00215F9A52|nr:RNA exonuclease 4-like [Mercurialis annua]